MALGSNFGVMQIVLAEPLLALGAPFDRCCQLQKTLVPFAEAIVFHSALVPVVAVVVAVWADDDGSGFVSLC
jgi:hypothetical protein